MSTFRYPNAATQKSPTVDDVTQKSLTVDDGRQVVETHLEVFRRDQLVTLINRLRHNGPPHNTLQPALKKHPC